MSEGGLLGGGGGYCETFKPGTAGGKDGGGGDGGGDRGGGGDGGGDTGGGGIGGGGIGGGGNGGGGDGGSVIATVVPAGWFCCSGARSKIEPKPAMTTVSVPMVIADATREAALISVHVDSRVAGRGVGREGHSAGNAWRRWRW